MIIVVDVETTGLGHSAKPPRIDSVLSIGLAWRGADSRLHQWEERCRPADGVIPDPIALRVNGLSLEYVSKLRESSEAAASIWGMLFNIKERSLADVLTIRSYNQSFDRPFLEAAPWSIYDSPGIKWGECIMLAATPPGGRWPRLAAACAARGIKAAAGGTALHSAGEDARLAYLLMETLERDAP